MRTFAIDFMLNGARVARDYVTATNEKHAATIALRTVAVEFDEFVIAPL